MSLDEKFENAEIPEQRVEIEATSNGGYFQTGALSEPITDDWSPILLSFGLDPEVFEVVNDKVRMSRWQQSKRLENGDRDTVWMYSYRAEFKRREANFLSEADVEDLRQRIAKMKFARRSPGTGLGAPSTMLVCWADWQLGKSAGGGVSATVERVEQSYEATLKRVKDLRRIGRNIEGLTIANMGDPVEGCDGNYASQLFTVELTQREQLLLALDLWTAGVRTLAPEFDKTTFLSVLCNHGEWTRRGGKAVTSDSDNASGFLTDTLERVLGSSGIVDNWVIPHDEMVVQHELSTIPVAFTHGHKIPSANRELDWLRGQSIKLLRENGTEPKLWVTAHKHHFKGEDMGAWWRFQCPSLDGGSKWWADISGSWSTPGTLTMLVGDHDERMWSDVEVL